MVDPAYRGPAAASAAVAPAGGSASSAERVPASIPVRRKAAAAVTLWPSHLAWVAALLLVGWIATLDVGVQNQMTLAACGVAFLLLLRISRLDRPLRLVFILVAAFLTLRYLGWRVTQTLPGPGASGFVPGVLLFTAELYGIVMYVVGLFVNLHPLAPRPPPSEVADSALPTVDVLVPSYNETAELLERTLLAALMMRHPAGKLQVYLLDDGGTEQKRADRDPAKARSAQERHVALQALCAEVGAHYLTRARNEGAKAGNINAALGRTSGELVLVLDADHVPTLDLLERTVGYFHDDPKLFLVQTPHFFLNPDPIERNLDTFDRMPSENEMFYCIGQRGLDFWNASFFCGSAAILRRTCLDDVGGIQGTSITEDAETALELHARGYRSLYVPQPMVAGLQPETFSTFIGQRTRWAQGMFQILLLKNPLLKRGLSFPQRVCYLSSSFFWLFPIARLLFILTPLTYLVFGLQIYEASFEEFEAYAVAHLVASLMLQNVLFGRVRWPFISELYEFAQAPFIAPALLSVALRPRSPTFKVTAKAETMEKRFVSHLAGPLTVLICILVVASVFGAWRWHVTPLERESLSIVLAWNVVNIIFVAAALGVTFEQRQVRGDPRVRRDLPAWLTVGDKAVPAVLTDLSASGARLTLADEGSLAGQLGADTACVTVQPSGEPCPVELPVRVRYASLEQEELVIGVSFAPRHLEDRRAIVRLMFGSSEVWAAFQASRQSTRSVPGGLLYLAFLAATRGAPAIWAVLTRRGDSGRKPAVRVAVPFELGQGR